MWRYLGRRGKAIRSKVMYRFLAKPKWILFSLAIAALMVLMINLGFWQLRRLHQREAFNEQVISRSKITALDATTVNFDDASNLDWSKVTATGSYEPVLGRVAVSGGWQILSPLKLSSGTTIVVVRGFTTEDKDQPLPPTGNVTIRGWLRSEPTKATRPAIDGVGHDLLLQSGETNDADLAPVELPTLDNGPHLSYACQWFFFTFCALVGWLLVVRRETKPKDLAKRNKKRFDKNQAVPWRDEQPVDSTA